VKEKLQNTALVAEIISAIAVVISLIYVGYQIQVNTAVSRLNSIQSITERDQQLGLALATNANLGIAFHKMWERQETSERERAILADLLYSEMRLAEDVYTKYVLNQVDDDFIHSRTMIPQAGILRSPALREVYEIWKKAGMFPHPFIDWFDSELTKMESNGDPF